MKLKAQTEILEDKTTHYKTKLEENSKMVKFFVSSDDSTRLICGWKTANMDLIYVYEKKERCMPLKFQSLNFPLFFKAVLGV